MKNKHLNKVLKDFAGLNRRNIIAALVSSVLVVSLSGCDEEVIDEILDSMGIDAQMLAKTNRVDLGQLQSSEPGHGRLGYRQPG